MTTSLLCRVAGCCLLAWGTAAAAAGAPALSDTMSLDEIARALEVYPPRWEFGDQRAPIMASLDRHVTVQIRKDWTDAERTRLKPLHAFYLQRVDRGLDALERARVTTGVHVFKFYSSSFVFKTAQGTVAVDFCQGPINNAGEPETRDEYASGFYWRPDQRDRLARLVDVYLITHRHHDHSDYSLAKRLAARGGSVVGPAQLKQTWPDLADKLTVPDYGQSQKFGPVEIFTMLGAQYSRNEPTGNATERVGVPNRENPAQDTETAVYLFKLGGITLLTGAENHVPGGDWLRRGVAVGFQPQVRLSLGQFQGERALSVELKTMKPLFRLPLHEYEMLHDRGGNRTGPLLQGSSRAAFERREMMPLLWGEDFHLTEEVAAIKRVH